MIPRWARKKGAVRKALSKAWRHLPTHEVREAAAAVKVVEREALAAMRSLADFDVMCALSEKLIKADRQLNHARRRSRALGRGRTTKSAYCVKVGERVRLKRSADRVLVIEDRGDLGAHGEQVVRLRFEDGSECEVPVTWLEPTRKP